MKRHSISINIVSLHGLANNSQTDGIVTSQNVTFLCYARRNALSVFILFQHPFQMRLFMIPYF